MKITRRPYEQNWSGNTIVYGFFDEESVHNHDLLFEVRIYFKNEVNAAAFALLTSVTLTPIDGSAMVDIATILHAALAYTMPDLNGAFMETRKQNGQFYVDYRRLSIAGDLNEAYQTESQYPRKVIKGGLHQFMWQGNNYWVNYFAGLNRFLTWQLTNRLAGPTERMYLAWYNDKNVAAGNISYQVVVTYTDSTTNTVTVAMPSFNNRVYFVPAGAAQLGIATPNKTVWFWTISILDLTNPAVPQAMSEVFTYYLDQRNDYNFTTLLYRNSLGGVDSVRVRGQVETNVALDGTDAEIAAPADWAFASTLPVFDRALPQREYVSYKADIGHLGKDEQDRLRDAFLYRDVWIEKAGRWWPVKLLSRQYRLRGSFDKRFTLPIEYTIADGGSYYYTPPIDLGPGLDYTNVCDATIGNIHHTLEYLVSDVGQVTWTFDVNQGADNIAKIQWRVPGFVNEWQDYAYPNINSLQTLHAAPGNYVIEFRAICEGGSAGSITPYGYVIPAYGEDPDPDPDPDHPLVYTSNLFNYTDILTPVKITIDGFEKYNGVVAARGYITFFAPAGTHNIDVTTTAMTASAAKLTSDGVVYDGAITIEDAAFINVVINGPITIELY